jgi:putative copper export protein
VLGGGWATSVVGLALFAEAQRRNAGASLGDLWGTSLGRALAWRAAALAVAGVLLVVTTRGPRIVRRAGQWLAALAALSGIAVHVSAGHAAGTGSWAWVSVAVQWAHFGAAGVWIGGLAALLVATRGASSQRKADAVRRYSGVATLTFLVVVATGLVRAFGELSAWNELTSTGYGRAVLAKTALLVGIAALAAAQRWRNLPRAATDMGPLRRAGGVELVVAVGAMLAAAVLGSVPPPATATEAGIVAVGADYATSVRVRLTAASAQPGGNQFAVRVVDHDSGRPVVADAISLEFTPLDDPGAAPTTLALEAGTDGSFAGSGANLAFDGRWQIGVLIQRGATSMTVPLEVEVRGPPQFVSVEQVPGQPVFYTIEAAGSVGFVRIWADRQEAGAVQVFATIVDAQMQELAVDQVVITLARGSASAAQQAVRRLAPGQFVADVTLRSGQTTVAVVAHAANGARLRAAVDLEIE